MAIKDYYVILGVPRTASVRRIRAAYRDLAKERHPDVIGPGGDEAFREINEAYEILSDPAKRRAHNVELRRAAPAFPVEQKGPPPLASEPISILRERDAIRPSFDALFEHLLRNFAGPPKAARLEGLHLEVVLSPSEALRGVELPVGVPVFRACPRCAGTGREWLFPCLRCSEQGWVEEQEAVRIRIPEGVQHGTVLDVALGSLGIRNLFLRLHVSVE